MKLIKVPVEKLVTLNELTRTRRDRVFEDHLTSSIREVGLVEPLKVAHDGTGKFLVVDGVLRLEAIRKIREEDPYQFLDVAAYVVPFRQRFEMRFQGDIFQDLLPSQLASLVEHLHAQEGVQKKDIARFIGISAATLRNYTGLWRLIQRGGLFSEVVRLMDHHVLPASNPFAWLRLNKVGIQLVLEKYFCNHEPIEQWLQEVIALSITGRAPKYSIQFVEDVTGALPSDCYRERQEVRTMKKRLGELRTQTLDKQIFEKDQARSRINAAKKHLRVVRSSTHDPVLQTAAAALGRALR